MATRARTGGRRPAAKKRSGCLIWLIPLSLGLILILANKDVREQISRFIRSISVATNTPPVRHPDRDPDLINTIISRDMQNSEQQNLRAMQKQLDTMDKTPPGRDPITVTDRVEKKTNNKPVSFNTTVYFVRYDGARDKIHLAPTLRKISRTTTPAQTMLAQLLRGPSVAEKRQGLATLIPTGTVVRRLHVTDGVLVIDFSGQFIRGQKFGKEGLILQIYQIVNSMSQFPSVKGVRFLIEGKTTASAGGDWIRMDRVFTRNPAPLE